MTKDCGMDCDKCRGVHNEGRHKKPETIKAGLSAVKKAVNSGVLTPGGGEPLKYPDLPDAVKYVKFPGSKLFISTNGVLPAPEQER